MGNFPELSVELALTTRPTESPAWTDITDKVLAISTQRGREDELAPMPMGTCELVLDNADRRFDPTYGGHLNYIQDPSGESGAVYNWWQRGSGAKTDVTLVAGGVYGSYCYYCEHGTGDDYMITPSITCGGGETWTYSAYISAESASAGFARSSVSLTTDAAATSLVASIEDTGTELVLTLTDSVGATASTSLALRVSGEAWVDGIQLEQASIASTYCDGDQADCTWNGFAHASTSYRGAPYYLNLKPLKRVRIRAKRVTGEAETTNLIINPSWETGTGGWTANNLTAYERITTLSSFGSCCAKISDTVSASAESLFCDAITVTAGTTYTASAYVRKHVADAAYTGTFGIDWYTSAGVYVSSSNYTLPAGEITTLTRYTLTATAPVGVGRAYVLFSDSGITAGDWQMWLDGVQFEAGGTATAYCDGDQENCEWTGAAHASASTRSYPWEDVFYGYVDGWPQSWQDGVIPIVNLRACDGFKVLSLTDLNETYVEETSGARILNVLDDIGWTLGNCWVLNSASNAQLGTTTILGPYGDASIATGDSTLQAQTVENANVLQYLNDVTDSEYGLLFMGKDGTLTFRNRRYDYGKTAKAEFSDAVGELGYADYQLTYDDASIYNEIRMCRIDGEEQIKEDSASQLDYFRRTLQNDRLLVSTDTEASARASALLGRYKDPRYRCTGFVLGGWSDADTLQHMLGLEIGDRIQITRRPYGGEAITLLFRIEGIAHQIGLRGQTWQTRFLLSTDPGSNFWMIAAVDAASDEWYAQAQLGETTILAY